ncbi:hypothetical protein OHB41_48345 [Streptomyces sp. NBC_01571]|uniref:hypothetical protein n=1 Tax=Streptomyces sp. NBC_01571 TaxID=2975883 RepID=UPI00225B1138|nr:hypothetical protein [Streptomyces sp. NBC_01571]MCX4580794.1 hypothetical protein [Streptomyces sp. NBC_01571]
MQTITERYGKKRSTIFFVCCFAIIGVLGFIKINGDDGSPDCARHFDAMPDTTVGGRNAIVNCMEAVEKWCASSHSEDPVGCARNVEIDGDDRNVGKE